MSSDIVSLVEAVNDLARVVIACNDKITTKAEAVRRMNMVEIKPSKIASLLAMSPKDVTSQISKMKKTNGRRKERKRG